MSDTISSNVNGDHMRTERAGVLVTGAAGYLGRLVVARLAGDATLGPVIAADVREVAAEARLPNVVYRQLDVRDADAVRTVLGEHPVQTVVHLAAILTPPRDAGRQLAWDVDVRGTRHVLESCVHHGIPKVIVTSSGAAYGYHADNPPTLDEDAPLRGNEVFPYSHHKRLVEAMLASFREEHPALRQLVFRVGTILGATTRNPITAIFERPVVMGLRGSASPFCFVWDEDVATCIVDGARALERTGTYNLAGDGTLTLAEIAKILGKPFVAIPPNLLRRGLRLLGRLGVAPYGPEQVLFLQHRPVLDNRRLRASLGFQPRTTREVFEVYRAGLAR